MKRKADQNSTRTGSCSSGPLSPPRRPRTALVDRNSKDDDAQIRVRTLSDMVAADGRKTVVNENRAWDILNDTMSRIEGKAGSSRMAVTESNPSVIQDEHQGDQGDMHLVRGGQQLPLDLSTKDTLRVVSSRNLDWCVACPAASEAAAVEAMLMDETVIGREKLFYQSLLSFRNPASGQASAVAKAWHTFVTDGMGTEDFKTYAKARLSLWEESLRSLFFRLRDGHVSRFYVQATTFSILFCNPGPGHSLVRAVVTGCTPGMQGLFTKAGISFLTASDAEKNVMRVNGLDAVQGLYEFLLSDGVRLGAAQDVPGLLCEKPFVGGTLHRSRVRSLSEAKTGGGSASASQFTLEVCGPLLPCQISRMVGAMEADSAVDTLANYEIILRTGRLAGSLNQIGDGPEEATKKRNFLFADQTALENMDPASGRGLPQLGDSVVFRVRKRGGALSYTLQQK